MTGGGGNHHYFKHPGGVIPNKVAILPGLDLKGDNGFVVAPPSIHASGGVYDWDGLEAFETPIAEAPDWLLRLIAAGSARSNEQSGDAHRVSDNAIIADGERNNRLLSIAGYYRTTVYTRRRSWASWTP